MHIAWQWNYLAVTVMQHPSGSLNCPSREAMLAFWGLTSYCGNQVPQSQVLRPHNGRDRVQSKNCMQAAAKQLLPALPEFR